RGSRASRPRAPRHADARAPHRLHAHAGVRSWRGRLLGARRPRDAVRGAVGARLPRAAHVDLHAGRPAPRGERGIARDRLDAGGEDRRARPRPRGAPPPLGPEACFGAIAVLYALGLLVSLGLPGRIGGPARGPRAGVLATLAEGARTAWAEPTVRAVLLITVLMNTLFFPYQHMLPVFARHVLGGGPEFLGALVAADGLGALLGALAIASQRGFISHRRLFALSVLSAPFLLLAFSASRWGVLCLAILLLIGALESGFAAMQSTLVLLSAPEASRGGAMGILSACIGTQPLGTLCIGLLATTAGVPLAMAANAALALALILPLALSLDRLRSRET